MKLIQVSIRLQVNYRIYLKKTTQRRKLVEFYALLKTYRKIIFKELGKIRGHLFSKNVALPCTSMGVAWSMLCNNP